VPLCTQPKKKILRYLILCTIYSAIFYLLYLKIMFARTSKLISWFENQWFLYPKTHIEDEIKI
jgi:hypothetical protein